MVEIPIVEVHDGKYTCQMEIQFPETFHGVTLSIITTFN